MDRARSFLRRRRASPPTDRSPEQLSSESVEQSNQSTLTTGEDSTFAQLNPFVATAQRRRSRLPDASLTDSPRLDSTRADSITRSMTKKWFGVEETGDTIELIPSVSTGTRYVRSWLDRSLPLEPHPAETEPRPNAPLPVQSPKDSASTQTVRHFLERVSWKCMFVQGRPSKEAVWRGMVLMCVGLLIVELGLLFITLSHYFPPSRSPSYDFRSPVLPFHEKYFKALIMEDPSHRFDPEFHQGLLDAATHLRVHVRVETMQGKEDALKSIAEAQDALFDGLMISAADDATYREALKGAHGETPVLVLGSLESHADLQLDTLDHVGDCETNVGRLAGQAMKEAGKKTALCLSHADNLDSVHRCRGFKEAFGKQTYELTLNTMMQSELKSKLIPIILDDKEINGLFVADPRSFGLVHQILRSLNRLCTHRGPRQGGQCIYLGAYGTDKHILKALEKRELQFTIDPQEYLRGYLATAMMTLASLGYTTIPSLHKQTTFLSESLSWRTLDEWLCVVSRLRTSAKEAERLLTQVPCSSPLDRAEPHFKFLLFGEASHEAVQGWKSGLRVAARDFNVYVQFHSFTEVTDEAEIEKHIRGVDGIGLAVAEGVSPPSMKPFAHTEAPLMTFGAYRESFSDFKQALHVGYMPHEAMDQQNAAVQGYLSVLFLYTKHFCGQSPSGLFNTATWSPLPQREL